MNDGPNVTSCFSFSRTLRKLHNYWVYAKEKHQKQTKITSHIHTELGVYKGGSLDNNKDIQTENIRRCFIFFIHERKLKQTEKKRQKNNETQRRWTCGILPSGIEKKCEPPKSRKTEIVCEDASLFVYRWRWWYRGVEVGRSRRQETDETTSSFFGDESARFRPATRPLRSSSPPPRRECDFLQIFSYNLHLTTPPPSLSSWE